MSKMQESAMSVFLFIPNIIGYFRVIFMMASFYFASTSPQTTLIFYSLAFMGDVVDGYAARYFNQCSIFGGHLDMITDRVSTSGLLVVVSHLYPTYLIYFVNLIVLDISSHWLHVMSVTQHHKSTEALQHRNAILRWYYSIYPLFGYCCVGTECFYICLYYLHHYPNDVLDKICFYVCFPACILKQIVNLIQLLSAAEAIAARDAAEKNSKEG